jgi:hypothetical protein
MVRNGEVHVLMLTLLMHFVGVYTDGWRIEWQSFLI